MNFSESRTFHSKSYTQDLFNSDFFFSTFCLLQQHFVLSEISCCYYTQIFVQRIGSLLSSEHTQHLKIKSPSSDTESYMFYISMRWYWILCQRKPFCLKLVSLNQHYKLFYDLVISLSPRAFKKIHTYKISKCHSASRFQAIWLRTMHSSSKHHVYSAQQFSR